MKARIEWTTKAERAFIYDEAIGLLERMGIRFGEGKALDVLAAAGATVDRATGVARIPGELVEKAMKLLPGTVTLGGATPDDDIVLDGGTHWVNSGTASHTVDMDTGEYRLSTADDLRKAIMVLDKMEALDVIWPIVACNDKPASTRILDEWAISLAHSNKHVQHELEAAWQVEPILRLAKATSDAKDQRERPRISMMCCTASPMQSHGPMLDACVELGSHGIPIVVYSMPVSGGTSPVTVAGMVTLNTAEFLGIATAIQLMAPGTPLIFGAGGAVLDMRTTTYAFGALEGSQMSAACTEIAHMIGAPSLCPALASDAKHVGAQAGYEKALRGMTVASSGCDLMTGGIGLLAGAGFLSMPQIIIDNEIGQMIHRLLGEVDFSADAAQAAVIERAGFGGDYLRQRETRARVRAGEQFFPTVASRHSYEKWETLGETEVDTATAKVREILAAVEAEEPKLTADQQAEIADIYAAAAGVAV